MDLKQISRQDCTFKIVLNKELFYLFGVYLSDGSFSERKFILQVIDKDFAEKTLSCIKKIKPDCNANIFERKSTIRRWEDGKVSKCQKKYCISAGFVGFDKFFIEQTNQKHHIPFCVWNANDGLKRWFIAGIMDGDGWISKTKRETPPNKVGRFQYRIGIGGVSEGWIHEFRQLLNGMNVKCNKVERLQTKDGKWFCRFNIKPKTFFDSKLFFTIERKRNRCTIASTTAC